MAYKAGYTKTAISLHWVISIALICTFILGLYVSDLPFSLERIKLISYHKWAGISILFLVTIRILWRLTHTPPALPISIPHWQQKLASITHFLLYVFMFSIPVSGWLYSSAAGVSVVYFGVIQLPNLIGADKALAGQLKEWHEMLNFIFAAFVLVHISAAVKHHFIDRDDTLTRMLPFLKSPNKEIK
jgi:cytochrome b561